MSAEHELTNLLLLKGGQRNTGEPWKVFPLSKGSFSGLTPSPLGHFFALPLGKVWTILG